MTAQTMRPPRAARVPHTVELHGDVREDPYAWLRIERWQAAMQDPSLLDAPVRAYLEEENAYTEASMADAATLRETLVAEMRARIKEDDASVPDRDGPFEYYVRYETGGEHPLYCRRPSDGGEEEVLLDGDAEARGHAYFNVAGCEHSPDHRLLAWAVDLTGSERYEVRVRDLATGRDLDDVLPDAHGDFAWTAGSDHLYYSTIDENHRPQAVKLHRLGAAASDDETVFEESDPGFFVGVSLTESRRFVVIDTHDHTTSESWLVPADRPGETPALVAARERDVEYDVSHHGERLVILTNAGGAEDFKLVEAPLSDTGRPAWRDLVAHRPGRLIVSFEMFAGYMVRLEREDALPRIVVTELATGDEHVIAQDEAAYSLGLDNGYEFDTETLRYGYSSPTTPARVYDYSMRTRERTLRKEQEVPSGHDPARYVTRRLLATAPDGEQIPITVLELAGAVHDGTAPLLLYGYGAYGISMPAGFSTNRLSLVDRGFAYAIAHVRGGMERGYRWYREGKLAHKTNTFTDFVAAAEHLVAEGFTCAGRIAAHGASAGGMLMGAIANARPDLFGAIVAEVPFVDVLATMCDDTLPLTPPEWPEWGDPLHDEAAYRRIRAYSPYDNVGAQDYPAILATGGVSDPRVTYWEPAKWVARLRELRTNDEPLLLKINLAAGHGGASGRFERLDEVALAYAFVIKVLAPAHLAAAS